MMSVRKFFTFLMILAAVSVNSAFSQEILQEKNVQEDEEKPSAGNYFSAFGLMEASNLALFCFNRFVTRAEYARISGETIHDNLTGSWVWDQDTFSVNQLGHPYQGSFYFNAARAYNIPFEQAFLYSIAGSVSWEYFAENETPSINDLICTTTGSAALGEMFHRLYLETASAAPYFAALLSPMDALSAVFGGPKKAFPKHSNITHFSNYLGAGPIYYDAKIDRKSDFILDMSDSEKNKISLNFCLDLEYGNPYNAKLWEPYKNFVLQLDLGISRDYYNVSIFSEGLLSRFKSFYGDYSSTMLGLCFDFDVIFNRFQNYADYGLCFVTKTSRKKNGWNYGHSLAAGPMFFGAADYYYLNSKIVLPPDDDQEHRLYDYNYGVMGKYNMHLQNDAAGTFRLYLIFAFMNTIKSAVPANGSDGYNIASVLSTSYEHSIYKDFSLGVNARWYYKGSYYESAKDVAQKLMNFSLYCRKIFVKY